MYFCVVICIVYFVTFPVLFVCTCVLNNCHRVATQLQLNIYYQKPEALRCRCGHVAALRVPFHIPNSEMFLRRRAEVYHIDTTSCFSVF
jgi:hypothetical protein